MQLVQRAAGAIDRGAHDAAGVVYSLTLKPLPFDEPENIVELYTSAVKAGLPQMPANAASYEALGLWTFFYGLADGEDATTRVPGVRMTAEMFQILRVQPVLDTFFTKE